jgi:hypothetical protein
MAGYKAASAFAIEALNKAPQTITKGGRARVVSRSFFNLSQLPDKTFRLVS